MNRTGKKLIVVAGYPAAGKSTFARALSEALAIPFFDKDTINETIGEHLPISGIEARRKLSETAVHLLLHAADRVLKTSFAVIIESNFKPQEAALVQALIEKRGCESLMYLFTGDAQVLYARYLEREQSGARHWIHKWKKLDTLDAFARAIKPLGDFRVGARHVFVDTTRPGAVSVADSLEIARQFVGQR